MKQWTCAAVISYQLNSHKTHHKRLFSKAAGELPPFLFVLLLSLVLMVSDARYHLLTPVRALLSDIVSPLRTISAFPGKFLQDSQMIWHTKQSLMQENQQLVLQQLALHEELQHLQVLRQENLSLKALLKLSEATARKSMAARVLAIDTGPTRHVMIINKGQKEHVVIGQPVLDQHGVIGQVIEVSKHSSTVLLISDSLSAVPVKNNRTGEMGILAGADDDNQLVLLHLSKTSSVMVNDLLVTSGLGGRYPEGYPVGRVSHIINNPGEHFIDVYVTPVALLKQSHLVLLIWPKVEKSVYSQHFRGWSQNKLGYTT